MNFYIKYLLLMCLFISLIGCGQQAIPAEAVQSNPSNERSQSLPSSQENSTPSPTATELPDSQDADSPEDAQSDEDQPTDELQKVEPTVEKKDSLDPENSLLGSAVVENLSYVEMESFPIQIMVTLEGYLSDGCTEINGVNQNLKGNDILLMVETLRPKDMICTQEITPFSINHNLDMSDLSMGGYRLVAGDAIINFTVRSDMVNNVPDAPQSLQTGMKVQPTNVRKVDLERVDNRVELRIHALMPGSCSMLNRIHQVNGENDTITFTVLTQINQDIPCTRNLVPTVEVVSIDMEGLTAGTYQLMVNDIQKTLEITADMLE